MKISPAQDKQREEPSGEVHEVQENFNLLNYYRRIGDMLQVISKISSQMIYLREHILDLNSKIFVDILHLFHTQNLKIFTRPRQTPTGYSLCKSSSINSRATKYGDLLPDSKIDQLLIFKWVFRNKLDESDNIVRNKARLVAQSYNQSRESILKKHLHRLHGSKSSE